MNRARPSIAQVCVLLLVLVGGTVNAAGGDGAFNMEHCLIPPRLIVSGGPPKDGIPALTNPKVLPAGQAGYLRPGDMVVGVRVGQAARAYPHRILVWHENVNDTLVGTPIAVSYCPLCNSAVVFDRRVGGEVREFGISGMLFNSNVLLYDRQGDPDEESLWSQLQMRAVCGPAAEERLRLEALPSEMVRWEDWRRRHPQTTVLSPDTGWSRDYGSNPYAGYFKTEEIMFPVTATSRQLRGRSNKELMVIVRTNGRVKAWAVPDVAKSAGENGVFTDTLGNVKLRFHWNAGDGTVRVESADGRQKIAVAYSFWFAWKSMYPDAPVYRPGRGKKASGSASKDGQKPQSGTKQSGQ